MFCAFSTFANPIIHRVYRPPPPPQILHNDCIRFLLGHEDDPREIENNAYAKFFFWGGGVKEVYCGICESREFEIRVLDWNMRLTMFSVILSRIVAFFVLSALHYCTLAF